MNYNLEHYVYMNLNKLGHEVRFYGYRERLGRLANPVRMAITRSKFIRDLANLVWLNRINDEIKKVAEAFSPDLVLSIKGEAVKPETIDWIRGELGAKTALWYPDDPRFFDSLVRYIAPSYDYVFTASEKVIPMYKEIGCGRVHFLPFACEETVHKKVSLTERERKEYEADVVFVGTYTPRRGKLIKVLEKNGVKVKVYGPYWKYFRPNGNTHDGIYGPEMVKAFNVAKIVLNIHVNDDLPYKVNMRTFEATGSRAFLLTDNAENVGKLFKVGKDLVVYNSPDELVDLVKYYLRNDEKSEEIAHSGYIRCHSQHIYARRLKQMLELV